MSDWVSELESLIADGENAVIVTVASIRGSAPREAGAKMVVTKGHSFATIGGGELEHQCTRIACRQLVDSADAATRLRKFTLGANCGQCCGGVVEILFEHVEAGNTAWFDKLQELRAERVDLCLVNAIDEGGRFLVTREDVHAFPASANIDSAVLQAAMQKLESGENAELLEINTDAGQSSRYMLEPLKDSGLNIAVFGAGHVGTATVAALAKLDCNIRWIDNRRNVFPAVVPNNVTIVETARPPLEIMALPEGSHYLVMTHSHSLDFEICDQVLRRGDAAYCGLIGSLSKRRRFERLMRQQGMHADRIASLVCPIGIGGIEGKQPEEIAISVSAEILRLKYALASSGACAGDNVSYLHRAGKPE